MVRDWELLSRRMCTHVYEHTHSNVDPYEGLCFYIHKHKFLSAVAFVDLRCLGAYEMPGCISVSVGQCAHVNGSLASAAHESEACTVSPCCVTVSFQICKQNTLALSTNRILPHKIKAFLLSLDI